MAGLSAGLPVVLRIAGEPVILIGDGEMADAKRRTLGSGQTGASIAIPIFEPIIQAV